jgi:hypothetical protein
MVASKPNGDEAVDRDDVIGCLANAWAMDRPAVQRTLSRVARETGHSLDDVAQSYILKLSLVAELLRPPEQMAATG